MNNHYTITNQFQGYFPNDNLVKKYGCLSNQQIIEQLRIEAAKNPPVKPLNFPNPFSSNGKTSESPSAYPIISLYPTSNMIVLNLEQWDYIRVFGSGLLFFVNAILITSKSFPLNHYPSPRF